MGYCAYLPCRQGMCHSAYGQSIELGTLSAMYPDLARLSRLITDVYWFRAVAHHSFGLSSSSRRAFATMAHGVERELHDPTIWNAMLGSKHCHRQVNILAGSAVPEYYRSIIRAYISCQICSPDLMQHILLLPVNLTRCNWPSRQTPGVKLILVDSSRPSAQCDLLGKKVTTCMQRAVTEGRVGHPQVTQ